MHTLLLERRGCEFNERIDPALAEESDIGNYRVCTPGYDILAKNGRRYFLEFTRYDAKALKRKNYGTVMENALHIDSAFEVEGEGCFRDLELESFFHEVPVKFTTQNILATVNEIAAEPYDTIKYVTVFTEKLERDANPAPRSLILRWAKANRLPVKKDKYDRLFVQMYSGLYTFLDWTLEETGNATYIKIYLERVEPKEKLYEEL